MARTASSRALGDLLVVGLLAVAAVLAVVFLPGGHPLRVALGLSLALLLPGYALVSALFPRASPGTAILPDRVGGLERVVLAVALSVALSALGGMALSLLPGGFRTGPLVALLASVTLLATVLAAWRRLSVAPEDRFGPPVARWRAGLAAQTTEADPLDAGLTVLVAVAVVVLLASLLFTGPLSGALASATGGDAPSDPAFTEAFLLNASGETPTGAAYPETVAPGESLSLTVGLTNREGTRQRYTIVVRTQRIADGEVVETTPVARFDPTLAPEVRWQRDHQVTVPETPGRARIEYLIYRGDPPASPSVDTAYRDLHLDVRVEN